MHITGTDDTPKQDITREPTQIDDFLTLIETSAREARMLLASGRDAAKRAKDASPIAGADGGSSRKEMLEQASAQQFMAAANSLGRTMLLCQDLSDSRELCDPLMQFVRQ